jgi:hypothetical protein
MKKREQLERDILELFGGPIDRCIRVLEELKRKHLARGYSDLMIECGGGGYDDVALEVWGERELTAEELEVKTRGAEYDAAKRVASLKNKPDVMKLVYEALKEEFEPQGRSTGVPPRF